MYPCRAYWRFNLSNKNCGRELTMASYDFKKVSLIVDGSFITGFMDGSPIKAEKNADNVTPHVGAAGETTYAENGDNTGMITVTVKAGSASLPKLVSLATGKREFSTSI